MFVARTEWSAGNSGRVVATRITQRNQACADCVNLSALLHPAYACWMPLAGKISDLITTGTAPEFGSMAPMST